MEEIREKAVENGCESVVFPNISTGIYGYPKKEAARISVETAFAFLSQSNQIKKVIFVCFDEENYQLIREQLD